MFILHKNKFYFASYDIVKTCIYFAVCYCGRSQRQVLCTRENSMVVYYSCGEPCEKKLSCGNHLCQKPCHSGQCELCKTLVVDTCPCGKQLLKQNELNNRTSCAQPIPTCGQTCAKPLECGPPGVLFAIIFMLFVCLLILNCINNNPENPHVCKKKCHEGPCAQCELKTKYVCKCGNKSKEIKCSSVTSELTCKKKCNKVEYIK